MFKKRVKKNKDQDINLAKEDLENKNNSDQEDLGVIKKKDKK